MAKTNLGEMQLTTNANTLAKLESISQVQRLFPNEVLFTQGQKLSQIYFVAEGFLSLDVQGEERSYHYGIRGPGELIADFSICQDLNSYTETFRASFSATALKGGQVIACKADVFRELLVVDFELTKSVLSSLSGQITDAFGFGKGDMFLNGKERVAKHLIHFIDHGAATKPDPNDSRWMLVAVTLKELERFVPGNARTVQRAIQSLTNDGFMQRFDRWIFQVDVPRLRKFVGGLGIPDKTSQNELF